MFNFPYKRSIRVCKFARALIKVIESGVCQKADAK